MQESHEDQQLRLRFRKLQEEVDSFAPPYSVPDPTPRRARIHLARPIPAFVLTAAALALGVGLRDTHRPLSQGYDEVLWRGQTDFLLDTPGRGLLFAVPRVDGTPELDTSGLLENADSQPFG